MSQIKATDLSFYYEGSYENIFEHVSFTIDTDWKLGLIGRNGRGKTTLFRLLTGQEEYKGSIVSSADFSSFPYTVRETDVDKSALELAGMWNPDYEYWKLLRECRRLELEEPEELLCRPFGKLSKGEQTKLMLAVLFTREQDFLLIDEPTNHLDARGRAVLADYLNRRQGFILISHDRSLLDGCIDHVMSLNQQEIEIVKGNFSSWYENKKQRDALEAAENERLKKDIKRLNESARRAAQWSDQVEKSKKGVRVAGLRPDRGHIGHMAAKAMKRSKNLERRKLQAADEKAVLLKNLETAEDLKLHPKTHHKNVLLRFQEAAISYSSPKEKPLLQNLSFELKTGERIALCGKNGCGKSSILKLILENGSQENGFSDHLPKGISQTEGYAEREASKAHVSPQNVCHLEGNFAMEYGNGNAIEQGRLHLTAGVYEAASGLKLSYVPQDASFLRGGLEAFVQARGIDRTLFLTILRKLDFARSQFEKPMESYSDGQKKKVLLAASLCESAHLYIWDEPLNYIDVFSRMQIEKLLSEYDMSMIFVEHDRRFAENIATKIIEL